MEKSRYTISAVERALRILKLFDQEHRTMSLTELSTRAGISKSSALRVLESLESEGFVKRIEETKKYKLGTELFILSNNGYEFLSLRDIAEPIIKKAVNATGLVGHMGILEEDKILFISRIWPEGNVEGYAIASTVGGTVPVHCTGVGKVLAAYAAPDIQEQLLRSCDYKKYTESTITTEEALREELTKIIHQGFGVNHEEHEPYVSCLTYPVFNYKKKIIAAVSLTGLTQVIQEKDSAFLHKTLKELSQALGKEAAYWLA